MKYEFGWTFLNKETGKLRRIVSFSFNKGDKIMMLNSEQIELYGQWSIFQYDTC